MNEAITRFQQARADIEADRPVDIAETYRIIEAAAQEGDPEALLFEAYALGVGYGCEVNLPLAFEHIYIADEAGAPDATPLLAPGAIVQLGSPEELVGSPADDYVANFVRDIPRAHVLTLRWIMRDPRPGEETLYACHPCPPVRRSGSPRVRRG